MLKYISNRCPLPDRGLVQDQTIKDNLASDRRSSCRAQRLSNGTASGGAAPVVSLWQVSRAGLECRETDRRRVDDTTRTARDWAKLGRFS